MRRRRPLTRSEDLEQRVGHAAPQLGHAVQEERAEALGELRDGQLRTAVDELGRLDVVRLGRLASLISGGRLLGRAPRGVQLEREDPGATRLGRGKDGRPRYVLAQEGAQVLDELVRWVDAESRGRRRAQVDEGGNRAS